MAERCPRSTFVGKATLRGYRWQINQRHVANIVRVNEDPLSIPAGHVNVVEGLVFSITDKDRRTLDRKEGIKLGVYERVTLNVLLERHAYLADEKTAFVRDRLQDDSDAVVSKALKEETPVESQQKHITTNKGLEIGKNAADLQLKPPVLPKDPTPSSANVMEVAVEEIEAITYLSTKYADDGLIRQEYIQRMENAISDAVKLGMSQGFVQRYLEPYVHGDVHQPEEDTRDRTSTSNQSVSEGKLEKQESKAKGETVSDSVAADKRDPAQVSPKPDQAHRFQLFKKKRQKPKV